MKTWNNSPTETIHLSPERTIQAEVNGQTPDGTTGYILYNLREAKVLFIDNTWRLECSQCHKPIDSLHTHTENGVKLNYCSYCYRSQFD